jgi:hypothetical protein
MGSDGSNGSLSDITIEILKDIREEMRGMRVDLRTLTGRVDHLTERVDVLETSTTAGFASMNARFDNFLHFAGARQIDQEHRLERLEDRVFGKPSAR